MTDILKAPFPYLGGKSTVAPLVWQRLGNVANYLEPFIGSAAMLLGRPNEHRWWEQTETINDADGMIANFWRATAQCPEEVARLANRPVNENDQHACHWWLISGYERLVARLEGDPDYCDPLIAARWLHGCCTWIGGGWCRAEGPWSAVDGELVNVGDGVKRQLPHLGGDGMGIHRKLPHLGGDGRGICDAWEEHLREMMGALRDRLRRVRVCCGDWSRICGPTPLLKHGTPIGVFLDPPYPAEADREMGLYAHDCGKVAHDAAAWAIQWGEDPRLRIVFCGYEGSHEFPNTWDCVAWKAKGGYGSQGAGRGRDNAHRERLWFSPHCLGRAQPSLFDDMGGAP